MSFGGLAVGVEQTVKFFILFRIIQAAICIKFYRIMQYLLYMMMYTHFTNYDQYIAEKTTTTK